MNKLIGNLVRSIARSLGFVIFRASSRLTWPEEDFRAQLFAKLKPDCVFDVGANSGQYALRLRESGFTGTILSFEPNPRAFAALQEAAADDPQWHCYPIALGAEKARLNFNVMAHDVLSSFNTLREEPEVAFIGGREVVQTLPVDVETLNAVLPRLKAEHGFKTPFLKIDTQGHDSEVLRGGSAVLQHFTGLSAEVSIIQLYEESRSIGESFTAFRAAGFYVVALFNVHPEARIRQMVECDCYCIREDLV
ncbi:MAG: FkbM family methyltransferase [Pseudomonadota bacterium]